MFIRISSALLFIYLTTGTLCAAEKNPFDEATPTDLSTLKIELSAKECYEREPLDLTVSWSVNEKLQDISAVQLRVPILADKRFKVYVNHFEPAPKNDAQKQNKLKQNAVGVPVSGLRCIAEKVSYKKEADAGSTLIMRFVVVPQFSGPLRLNAAAVAFAARKVPPNKGTNLGGHTYAPWFNNRFFEADLKKYHKIYSTTTSPMELSVKPLPKPIPKNFTGAFEPFNFLVHADPTRVGLGSPIKLTLTTGELTYPRCFSVPASFWQFDPHRIFIAEEEAPTEIDQGCVSISQIATVSDIKVRQIPKLRLSYLDREKGMFVQCSSPALPLIVTRETVGDDLWSIVALAGIKNLLVKSEQGITPLYSPEAVQQGMLVSGRDVRLYFLPLAIFLFLPVGYWICIRLLELRRFHTDNPQARPRRRALGHFRKNLKKIDKGQNAHRELYYLLCHYFATVCDIRPGALTLQDMRNFLAQNKKSDLEKKKYDEALTQLYEELRHPIYSRENEQVELASLTKRALEIVSFAQRDTDFSDVPSRRVWGLQSLLLLGASLSLFVGLFYAYTQNKTSGFQTVEARQQREVTLQDAEKLFSSAAELYANSPREARSEFASAAALYEITARELPYPAKAQINAATAWFLAGNLGKASCLYQQAQIAGGDAEVTTPGLEAVRHLAADSFQVPQDWWSTTWRTITGWFTEQRFAVGFCVFYTLGFILLTLHRLLGLRRIWSVATFALAALLLLPVLATLSSWFIPQRGAVIISQTMVRQGNADFYEPLYRVPLHCGAEFKVLPTPEGVRHKQGWIYVEFPDQQRGWIETNAVALTFIRPQKP